MPWMGGVYSRAAANILATMTLAGESGNWRESLPKSWPPSKSDDLAANAAREPMTNGLYMVVEHFKGGDAVQVYRRHEA